MSARARLARAALVAAAIATLVAAACGGESGAGDDARPTTVAVVGERIALVRDQRLLVRAPDGAERLLFRPEASNVYPAFPAWSPDGARVAFVQSRFAVTADGDWGDDVYVIDAAGGEPRLAWSHALRGQQVQGLTWTVDGNALLVGMSTPETAANGTVVAFRSSIERIDLAAGSSTRLVDGAVEPSLSRDGTRLVYLVPDTSGATRVPGLWIAAGDGSDARALPLPDNLNPPFAPRISPDATSIAFAAPTSRAFSARPDAAGRGLASVLPFAPRRAEARGAGGHGVPMEVWRVDIADATFTPLTSFGEDDPRSAWEPDGAALIVIGAGGLYRVASDGSGVERIDEGAFAGQLDVR